MSNMYCPYSIESFTLCRAGFVLRKISTYSSKGRALSESENENLVVLYYTLYIPCKRRRISLTVTQPFKWIKYFIATGNRLVLYKSTTWRFRLCVIIWVSFELSLLKIEGFFFFETKHSVLVLCGCCSGDKATEKGLPFINRCSTYIIVPKLHCNSLVAVQ